MLAIQVKPGRSRAERVTQDYRVASCKGRLQKHAPRRTASQIKPSWPRLVFKIRPEVTTRLQAAQEHAQRKCSQKAREVRTQLAGKILCDQAKPALQNKVGNAATAGAVAICFRTGSRPARVHLGGFRWGVGLQRSCIGGALQSWRFALERCNRGPVWRPSALVG